MVVKATQPARPDDLATWCAAPALVAATGTTARTVTSGPGRIEGRARWTSPALEGDTDWPGRAQALGVARTSTTKRTGQQRHEWADAVTSLAPARAPAPARLPLWRGRWGIEHRRPWVREVTFDEARAQVRAQVRAGAGPQALAARRHTVSGRLRAHGDHAMAASRRHLAGHVEEALALVGLTAQ